MKRFSLFLLAALGGLGLRAGAQPAPTPAALPQPVPSSVPLPQPAPTASVLASLQQCHYVVRYLCFTATPRCFTATPRPGAVFPETLPSLPTVWQNLQDGWPVPLTADPQAFLAALRRVDPRYTYRLDLAGQARPLGGDRYRLLSGPQAGDARGCRVDFTLSLVACDTPWVIRTHLKGGYQFVSNPAFPAALDGAGCDDTSVPQGNLQVLDQTKSLGIDGTASQEKTVFVYCLLPAPPGGLRG